MGQAPQTALIVEGAVSDSWLLQIPSLRPSLGPVLGISLRSASRAVNQLKGGLPVSDVEPLLRADLLLISVPADSLPRWLEKLSQQHSLWRKTAVVICSNELGSESLASLKARGAATGSLSPMDGMERRYLFEGHKLAGRRVRRLVEDGAHSRVFEIKAGHKAVYDAGLSFAAGMTFPLIAAAVDAMRAAGLHGKFAEATVENAVIGALRSFLRAGRRGWTGPVARADRQELARQYQALFAVDPHLAELFLKLALDHLTAKGRKTGRGTQEDPSLVFLDGPLDRSTESEIVRLG